MTNSPVRALISLAMLVVAVSCSSTPADVESQAQQALDAALSTTGITGTISGLAGTCPAISFALEGKTMKTNASTAFADRACSALANGQRVTVTGASQSDNSVLAMKVVPIAAVTTPTTITVAGTVKTLSGACPAVIFKLESKTIVTSATTTFGDGGCAAVKNDWRVEISGVANTDTSIVASKVSTPTAVTTTAATTVTVTGAVSELKGTCPALTFGTGGRSVTTSGSTLFDGTGCGDYKNGTVVVVVGTQTSTGASIVATKINVQK